MDPLLRDDTSKADKIVHILEITGRIDRLIDAALHLYTGESRFDPNASVKKDPKWRGVATNLHMSICDAVHHHIHTIDNPEN